MSVATLGFQVNSAPLVGATKALHDLTAAAKPAAQAATELSKASTGAATGAAHLSTAAEKAASGGAKALTTQTGLARHELINLSRQIQDVGVSLVSGQSFFMVLAQQGAQVADIFGSSKTGTVGGAMRQIGSGILSVITPMRLLGVGVAAAGAAAYVAYGSWKSFTLQLDDAARAAGTTTASMSALQAAASFKGIAADDFNKGMQSFAGSVYEAQHNMGALAQVFRANNVHAATFDEAMEKAATLIQRAGSDQQRLQLLQQMGLPATMEWVRLLSSGAEGLRAAKNAAAEFAADDALVRKAREFDEAWNKAWTNFGLNARSAFQTALSTGSTLFDRMEKLAAQAGNASFWQKFIPPNVKPEDFGLTSVSGDDLANGRVSSGFDAVSDMPNNPALQNALQKRSRVSDKTVNPNDAINANRMAQQRISMLGELATVADQVQAKELELNAAWLQGGVGVGKYKDAILNLVRAQAEMSRVQQQASIGVFNLNDANKAAADTLQTWIDKKLLDPTNAEQLAAAHNMLARSTRELSDAAKVAGSNLPGLQQAINDAGDSFKQIDRFAVGSVNSISSGFASWITGAKSFKDAMRDTATSVINDMVQIALKAALLAPFGGSTSGIANLFGLVKSADGNVFPANDNGISRYSNQIVDKPTVFAFANGVGLMGEAGAEAIMPLTRGPNGKLGVAASGAGGGQPVQQTFEAPQIVIQGNADDRAIRDIKMELANHRKILVAQVKQSQSSQRFQATGVA